MKLGSDSAPWTAACRTLPTRGSSWQRLVGHEPGDVLAAGGLLGRRHAGQRDAVLEARLGLQRIAVEQSASASPGTQYQNCVVYS